MPNSEREIIYVGDPMCSWCWGFAPVAERLATRFREVADFRVIAGGLRPGEHAAPLDESLKSSIRPHWEKVEAMTSQAFDYSIFDRDDFVYDTEPACRAVVCVRRMSPERTLDTFLALQKAFYADGLDITATEVIAGLIEAQGIERDTFLESFRHSSIEQYTYADFAMASRLGAQAFPTVYLRNEDDVALLTMGYQPYEVLAPAVDKFFSSGAPSQLGPEQPAPV